MPGLGHRVHVTAGIALACLGAAGLSQGWTAFGQVVRGLVPFGLLSGGLVMVGAGVRSLRSGDTSRAELTSVTPLLAVAACLGLAVAAIANADLGVPTTWTPGLVMGYVALGFVSGVIGGMLGLGGGLVHLAGMTLIFDLPFALARGATLFNNVFINGAAALRYRRQGLLQVHAIGHLLPAALLGVAAGSLLQERLDDSVMRKLFTAFVLLVSGATLVDTGREVARDAQRDDRPEPEPAQQGRLVPRAVPLAVTGGAAGVVSGLLGVSGGIVAVPGQTLTGSAALRHAIANSTLLTAVSSALGSTLVVILDSGPILGNAEMSAIALLFVPGNLVGGHLGASWMTRLPVPAVRACFIAALVGIAVRSWSLARLG